MSATVHNLAERKATRTPWNAVRKEITTWMGASFGRGLGTGVILVDLVKNHAHEFPLHVITDHPLTTTAIVGTVFTFDASAHLAHSMAARKLSRIQTDNGPVWDAVKQDIGLIRTFGVMGGTLSPTAAAMLVSGNFSAIGLLGLVTMIPFAVISIRRCLHFHSATRRRLSEMTAIVAQPR